MTKEIDVRYMIDDKGNQFYPIVNIESVEGFDQEGNFEAVNSLQSNVSDIQQQIWNLQSAIGNIPSITDTGWQNITLNSDVTAYSTSWTPQYRFITMNGVSFLSLKGGVKGLTGAATIGTLPSNVANQITDIRQFVEAMSVTSSTPNFNRWRIQKNGNIDLEYSTTTISNTQWLSIDTTIML